MRILIDVTSESGITFGVTLTSDVAFVSSGMWMCPPSYLLVWSGYFRLLSGDVRLFANDPGYLLGDWKKADMQAMLKNFKAKNGASGEALIYDPGPLGARLAFTQVWKVREAIGIGQMKMPSSVWDRPGSIK